ncbi:hypothetical protein BBO99_00007939 [Phytophthora kernoviae]|uniref:RPA-interacting protein C-terminal domain-containing protein n=2 Tax=Phytophthora kernoviae TaxID=325452 RepID=A0A421F9N9_9STRA|nr:hypothetical protein G195_005209 [Phytophthora kernoviae 00238/432]KAG2516572.1 hypothetical protein JM16_007608 [Phytophthora kernoviae]KAG2519735.1 hypothetical protein JM18_007462 [Phytophthora kernoviae]RLN31934.1 hypothetical protein BBI17_007831 [Phytophthora kernoviae]RLN75946.1 hypothetical protein BBO99_00007939 [Phytophthora kernoviae]
MQRLVAHEQQQQQEQEQEDANSSVDDLLAMGKLKENDYLEIVHALEDALRQEMEEDMVTEEQEQGKKTGTPVDELMAQQMEDLEDAQLEAMLAGMGLGDEGTEDCDGELEEVDLLSMLCPICKAGYLREHTAEKTTTLPFVSCACGFTFHVKYVYHGVLEDFQDKIVSAFMAHRDMCFSDPTFVKKASFGALTDETDEADALCIKCADCGYDHVLP